VVTSRSGATPIRSDDGVMGQEMRSLKPEDAISHSAAWPGDAENLRRVIGRHSGQRVDSPSGPRLALRLSKRAPTRISQIVMTVYRPAPRLRADRTADGLARGGDRLNPGRRQGMPVLFQD